MDREIFRRYLEQNIMILDGATGTELQKRGMPTGVCPEQWVLQNPQVIIDIQKEYINTGSNAVYSCTFSANRIKLGKFGLSDKVIEFNKSLVQLSKKAAGTDGFVAGDLAPTGELIYPMGNIRFEEIVDIYKEQVQGLLEGGVDFFIIETMMDIQEARAALLAVKENCDLPVCVSMSFDENGRTLTGTDPVTALLTLQGLGADAVGCNCSTGPEDMLKVIDLMRKNAAVPLLAKPNAGIPVLKDGSTVFNMGEEEFGKYIPKFIDMGVSLIGGCCGTTPEYIKRIRQKVHNRRPVVLQLQKECAATSVRKTVYFGHDHPKVVVGTGINAEMKRELKEELIKGDIYGVWDIAKEQVENGAAILNINIMVPGIDEIQTMVSIVELLSQMGDTPLCIHSSSPEVVESALRVYPGRALINLVPAHIENIEKLNSIAEKYGALFIEVLCNEAQKSGHDKNDILADRRVDMTLV